jgi:NTP pyrophosphatase (non-canonical NTP hydrolase)
MDLLSYQEKALRTESKVDHIVANATELKYVLGAFEIVTEMLDCLKKKIYYNNSKKYNEQFHDLAERLHFMTTCCDRHHDIEENVKLPVNPRVFHGIIGIATESGELISALHRSINGDSIDGVNVMEELGDLRWYDAILHDALDLDPHETMDINIKKLAKRYPEKYTDLNAEVRDLEAERKILEGN